MVAYFMPPNQSNNHPVNIMSLKSFQYSPLIFLKCQQSLHSEMWKWLALAPGSTKPEWCALQISEMSSQGKAPLGRAAPIILWPHSVLVLQVPPSLFCFVLLPGPRTLQALPYSVLPTTLGGNTIIFATLQIQGGSERLNNWPKVSQSVCDQNLAGKPCWAKHESSITC